MKPLSGSGLEECDPVSHRYKWTLTVPPGPDPAPGKASCRREREQLPGPSYPSHPPNLSPPFSLPAASSWLPAHPGGPPAGTPPLGPAEMQGAQEAGCLPLSWDRAYRVPTAYLALGWMPGVPSELNRWRSLHPSIVTSLKTEGSVLHKTGWGSASSCPGPWRHRWLTLEEERPPPRHPGEHP